MKKVLLCLIMLLVLYGCSNNKAKEDVKNIIVKNMEESDNKNGLSIRIDSFTYKDGNSTINLLITNNNEYVVYIDSYEVKLYDNKNNLIGELTPKFDSDIKGKTTTNHMFGTDGDFSNAYRIEYNFKDVTKLENN